MSKKEQLEEEITQNYKNAITEGKTSKLSIDIAIEAYNKIVTSIAKYKTLMSDPELGRVYSKKMEQEVILLLAQEFDMSYYEGMMAASMKLMTTVMAIPQIKQMNENIVAKATGNPDFKEALEKALGTMGLGDQTLGTNDSPFANLTRSKKENLN